MGFSDKKITFTWWFAIILFMMIWPMFVGPYIALSNPSFFLETESIKFWTLHRKKPCRWYRFSCSDLFKKCIDVIYINYC